MQRYDSSQFWILSDPVLNQRKLAWWDYGKREDPYICKFVCASNPEHRRHARVKPLKVGLVGGLQDDFVWTWHSDCLIQPQVAEFLRQEQVTGYSLEPVQARHRNRKLTHPIPELFELIVHGRAGRLATPGLELTEQCPDCGREYYRSVNAGQGVAIDLGAWDGSDIFRAWPYPGFVFITDRLAKALLRSPFKGFSLVCPELFENSVGAAPGSYSGWLEGDYG